MLFDGLGILASIAILSVGGEALVRYAVRLAAVLNISPTVVGLTVVAFGTSAPELATALFAAFDGYGGLAVGNVIGSNIANIGLILGATAVLAPMVAERRFVRREVLFLVITALALSACIAIGSINRPMALILLLMLGYFLRMLLRDGTLEEEIDADVEGASAWAPMLGTMVGLALLIFGARWLVVAATNIAEGFGVSERVIGLTVVAFGTSVPELAASVVAAIKKEVGLVLGNIVGSNIFNTLLILPAAILVQPLEVQPSTFGIDLAVMLGFSLMLLVVFLRAHRLNRVEGAVMFLAYCAYVVWLGTQSGI